MLAALALLLAAPALATPLALEGEALLDDADTRGSWLLTDDAAVPVSEAPGHMNVLLPAQPERYDGTTRAEVWLTDAPHATVLVRAHTRDAPAGSLEGLSAVGLTLLKDGVRWDRWDAGVTLPISPTVSTPLAGRRVVVTLTAEGATLRATVHEGDTLLVETSVHDTGSGSGRSGLRVHRAESASLARLEVDGPVVETPVLGDPDAPLGVERFVLLPADERGRVPADLARSILGVWPYDERGHLGLLLPDQAALDRLTAAGATPEVRPLVPFWAWDADVRRAARTVPLGPEGPDLAASYKDPAMVEAVLRDWAARYPDIARLHTLAGSHRGRPVLALRITDHPDRDEGEPAVLITGATHGSELLSTEYALDAAERLLRGHGTDPAWTRRVEGLDTWVVPLVNPDGNAIVHEVTRFGGRKNGRDTTANGRVDPWEGVDLNRNFPLGFGRDETASRSFPNSAYHRGPAPLSEPESQGLYLLATTYRPAAALSFHTNGSMLLVPYTLDGVPQPAPNPAWAVARDITADVPEQPSGRPLRLRRQIYPVDGTDQDWLFHRFGSLAYIVEGSHHNPTSRRTRLASVAALRPLVPALLDRVLDGPRLTVRVRDARGAPVVARVEVDRLDLRAGEVWTTRARDGRLDLLLDAPGPLRVTVTAWVEGGPDGGGHAAGEATSTTVEAVADPLATVDLTLPAP